MWNEDREVRPEWLDHLPSDDPRAANSRRDLRRINGFMLQAAVMGRALSMYCLRPPRYVLDLGAGDGVFTLKVARRLASRWRGVTVFLLDRQELVSAETQRAFHAIGWSVETIESDVFDFLQHDSRIMDVTIANLFLHHFPQAALSTLLELAAQRTGVFAASEPRRAPFALAASHLVWAIGCNDVSQHDAVASVRAGFRDSEISALWPRGERWELHEWPAMMFSHCFVARRQNRMSAKDGV
jgi:SAM-dependent methyltransferase